MDEWHKLKDQIRNNNKRDNLGGTPIEDKI